MRHSGKFVVEGLVFRAQFSFFSSYTRLTRSKTQTLWCKFQEAEHLSVHTGVKKYEPKPESLAKKSVPQVTNSFCVRLKDYVGYGDYLRVS